MKAEEAISNSEDIAALIAQQPATTRVTIHRMDEKHNRWVYIGASVPQQVSEEFLQDKYARRHGGGMFTIKLHDESGQIIKTKWNIPIGDPVDEEDEPARGPLAPIVAAPAAGLVSDSLALMHEELRANRELMREMIHAFSKQQPAQQTNMLDLVTAMEKLKRLEPPPAPAATDLFVKGMEAAMKLKGAENGETSWLDFAREVLQEAKPLLQKALTPGAVEQAVDGDQAELVNAIQFLKAQCAAGNSVALWVAYIMENVDKEVVSQIAAQPFEAFVAMDAELGNEPYREWFTKLQGALRAAIHNSEHSNGAGGNGSDVKPNGGAGPVSAAPPDRPAAGPKVNRRPTTH